MVGSGNCAHQAKGEMITEEQHLTSDPSVCSEEALDPHSLCH